MKDIEIWKPVPGFEKYYEVSNTGKVKSYRKKTPIIIKPQPNNKGYLMVQLGRNNHFSVHRLVWMTFNGLIPENLEINHKNEIPSDNNLSNLELVTHKENCNYGSRNCKIRKRILQFDIEGNLIQEHESITKAAKTTGYSQGNICNCCKGNLSQAYGYIWRYKNPDD